MKVLLRPETNTQARVVTIMTISPVAGLLRGGYRAHPLGCFIGSRKSTLGLEGHGVGRIHDPRKSCPRCQIRVVGNVARRQATLNDKREYHLC